MVSVNNGTLTNYNNSIQLLGASSGLDVSGLINAQLQMERLKIDPLYTSQELYGQKKDVWGQFKTQMNNVLTKANELKNLSNLNQSATTSKDGIVNVTANGEAVAGTYNLSVSQLATSHKIMSDAVSSVTNPLGYEGTLQFGEESVEVTSEMTLKDIAKAINRKGVGADATVVGGHLFLTSQKTGEKQEIVLSSTGDAKRVTSNNYEAASIKIKGDIASLNDNYRIAVDQLATNHKVESNIYGNQDTLLNYNGSFSLNGVNIDIVSADKLSDVVKKINDSDAGVKANIVGKKLVLEAKETGIQNQITLSDNTTSIDRSEGLFQHLGMTDGTNFLNVQTEAEDARYTIDGVEHTSSKNQIDTLEGLTVELKQVTTEAFTVTVEKTGVDIATSIGLIAESGSYKNEMQKGQDAIYTIEGIARTSETNTITDAVADMTFQLLKESEEDVQIGISQNTDALTSKMKEFVGVYNSVISFINQTSAEAGVFQGDSLIRNAKTALRSILFESGPNGMMMFEIGIQGNGALKDGSVQFDEAKFKEAIQKNYDGVTNFLSGELGVAKKFYDKLNEFTKTSGMIDAKTESLTNSINRLQKSIDQKETNFEKMQERLIKKYSQMESALALMGSQMSFLTAQIESSNNND